MSNFGKKYGLLFYHLQDQMTILISEKRIGRFTNHADRFYFTFYFTCLNAQSGKEETAFLPLFSSSIKKSAKKKMRDSRGDP